MRKVMMRQYSVGLLEAGLVLMLAPVALGQSSSLLVGPPAPQPVQTMENAAYVQSTAQRGSLVTSPVLTANPTLVSRPRRVMPDPMLPAIRESSLVAVTLPEPRTFQKYDLISVIVSEVTTSQSNAALSTEKDTSIEGEINDFTDLKRLLTEFTLSNYNYGDQNPRMGVELKNSFSGEGDYARQDSMSSRVQARVIDIKPNGSLVLEARKHIRNDRETLDLVLTGTCRSEDVTYQNTILSTQLYDLRVSKQHTGEVRNAARKGILTRLGELLFNL